MTCDICLTSLNLKPVESESQTSPCAFAGCLPDSCRTTRRLRHRPFHDARAPRPSKEESVCQKHFPDQRTLNFCYLGYLRYLRDISILFSSFPSFASLHLLNSFELSSISNCLCLELLLVQDEAFSAPSTKQRYQRRMPSNGGTKKHETNLHLL